MSDKNYTDISIQGELDAKGVLITYEGRSAVENAIRLWLTSFPKDFINQPNKGGYLTQFLSKPMSPFIQEDIKATIEIGFYQEFFPKVIIQSVEVSPNYEGRYWDIKVFGFCPEIQDKVSVEIYVKPLGEN